MVIDEIIFIDGIGLGIKILDKRKFIIAIGVNSLDNFDALQISVEGIIKLEVPRRWLIKSYFLEGQAIYFENKNQIKIEKF